MVADVFGYFDRCMPRSLLPGALFRHGWLAIGDRLAEEKERFRLWVPVFFASGIGLYFSLRFEPWAWLGACLTLPLLVFGWRLRASFKWASLILLLSGISAAGFTAAQIETARAFAPMLHVATKPVRVAGRLEQIEQMPQGARLLIQPKYIAGLHRTALPQRIRIHVREGVEQLGIGDWVSLRAMLLPPPPPSLPGGYDFQRQAYFERLGAVGFGIGHIFNRPEAASSCAGQIIALRHAMAHRIQAALPGTEGSIAAAIITGQRDAIPAETNQDFRNSGLSHLLVIAGLHMSLVIGFAFFAIRGLLALIPPVALRYPIKKWAAMAALILALAYLIISGAAIPTGRAFVMCALVLIATLSDRMHVSMHGVALAALAALLLDPEALTRVSFQMSFAAVVGLVGFYEAWGKTFALYRRDTGLIGKIIQHILGVALTTIIATIATAPFSLYHFNQIALFSILANVVAVPIAAFWIMPWALVSCLLMPFDLQALGLVPMGWGLSLVEHVAHWTGSLPYAVLQMPTMPDWGLILIVLGGLWLCLWQGAWRRWGLVAVVIGAASYCFVVPPDLLVAPDAKLVAFRTADGVYHLSSSRSDKMVAEAWQQAAAGASWTSFPEDRADTDGEAAAFRCDGPDCRADIRGHQLALQPWNDIPDGCPAAELIVSRRTIDPTCRAGITAIDQNDLALNGGYAIWIQNKFHIETVNQRRGDRPWVIRDLTKLNAGEDQ